MNRKPKSRFFRSFFVGFSRPKTDFFFYRRLFFGCPKKKRNPKKTDSVFFGRFFYERSITTAVDVKVNKRTFYFRKTPCPGIETQVLFLQPTAGNNRPKPTDVFGENPKKNDRAIITFGVFSVHNPGRHITPTRAH